MEYQHLQEHIEDLIDANDLTRFLDALATVCYEKAEHVQSNWQDEQLASFWLKVGEKVNAILAE